VQIMPSGLISGAFAAIASSRVTVHRLVDC
jgi:hypothetical protein